MKTIKGYLDNSARTNVEAALDGARRDEARGVFINLIEERALERAEAVDSGRIKGRLAGVPFAVKDNIFVDGAPTTGATSLLEGFEAPLQATIVARLEAEGAICIGKANLSQLGVGAHDASAQAVALGVVPFAISTDTDGALRQSAQQNNGVLGLRPSYGAVSRYGVMALASSLDAVGCIARSASDLNLVMSLISAQDDNDPTSRNDFFAPTKLNGPVKIGVIKELVDACPDDTRKQLDLLAENLRQAGHEVAEVSLPVVDYASAVYQVIAAAEASSSLARLDSVRYGKRSSKATNLDELYGRSRQDAFGFEVKRQILLGSYVLSSQNFESHFRQAGRVRTLLIAAADEALDSFDFLLTPEAIEGVAQPALVLASLAGLPALNLPGGQLIGATESDARLLALVETLEEEVK